MPKVPSHVLQHAPWSPSKASLAGQCPLAFKYRYVDKIPTDVISAPAEIGVTVHMAQELVLQGEGTDKAIETAIEDNQQKLTTQDIETVRSFQAAINKFMRKVDALAKKHPVKQFFIEQKWAVDADFNPCDFWDKQALIRGVVDFAILFKNRNLLVIDHKTGKVKSLSNFGTQLDFYKIKALANFPDIRAVQCAVHFMKNEKIDWATPTKVATIRNTLQPWLVKYLSKKSEAVATEKPKKGFYCSWCDYKSICPVWQE